MTYAIAYQTNTIDLPFIIDRKQWSLMRLDFTENDESWTLQKTEVQSDKLTAINLRNQYIYIDSKSN